LRVAISAVPVAIVGVIMWSARPEGGGDVNAMRIALAVAGLALVVAGLLAWGARFAWSWIVAGLALEALGGLRDAAYGAVWQPRVAGVLVFLLAASLIALIARRASAGRGGGEPGGGGEGASGGTLPAVEEGAVGVRPL
jgi:peptidoglycan/LPS O-acetylase OafA/YrhL